MSGKHVVAIIQARMDSNRLPGKVLLDLGGATMLARVVRRTLRATRVDRVVVATTTSPGDVAVREESRALGIACFCGSQEDVLDRYCEAAAAHAADVVVRITSDCPLIDPEVIDRVVEAFLDLEPDYASNTVWRTFPRGLDTEVMSFAALRRAWREAMMPYQRTHVTPYLYQNPEVFAIFPVIQREDLSTFRWTVDTAEDLRLLQVIYERLGPDDAFSWRDVCRLMRDEPHLAELNRHIRQKRMVEG